MSSKSIHNLIVISFFVLAFGWLPAFFISEILANLMIFGSLGMVVLMFISASNIKEENEKDFYKLFDDTKSKLTDFNIDKEYISKDDKLAVLVDENNDVISFFDRDNLKENFSINKYTYRDILEIETFQDGKTLTKTNRGSQIGGALLGSVLAGGIGAAIGGLSGSSTSEDKVESLCLRVVINDTNNPVRLIYFLKSEFGVRKHEDIFVQGEKDLEHWYSLFKIFINKADKEDEESNGNIEENSIISSADELKKYSELLKDGFITRDEYNTEKQKLLNR